METWRPEPIQTTSRQREVSRLRFPQHVFCCWSCA